MNVLLLLHSWKYIVLLSLQHLHFVMNSRATSSTSRYIFLMLLHFLKRIMFLLPQHLHYVKNVRGTILYVVKLHIKNIIQM
jgi:hypothetical protein